MDWRFIGGRVGLGSLRKLRVGVGRASYSHTRSGSLSNRAQRRLIIPNSLLRACVVLSGGCLSNPGGMLVGPLGVSCCRPRAPSRSLAEGLVQPTQTHCGESINTPFHRVAMHQPEIAATKRGARSQVRNCLMRGLIAGGHSLLCSRCILARSKLRSQGRGAVPGAVGPATTATSARTALARIPPTVRWPARSGRRYNATPNGKVVNAAYGNVRSLLPQAVLIKSPHWSASA